MTVENDSRPDAGSGVVGESIETPFLKAVIDAREGIIKREKAQGLRNTGNISSTDKQKAKSIILHAAGCNTTKFRANPINRNSGKRSKEAIMSLFNSADDKKLIAGLLDCIRQHSDCRDKLVDVVMERFRARDDVVVHESLTTRPQSSEGCRLAEWERNLLTNLCTANIKKVIQDCSAPALAALVKKSDCGAFGMIETHYKSRFHRNSTKKDLIEMLTTTFSSINPKLTVSMRLEIANKISKCLIEDKKTPLEQPVGKTAGVQVPAKSLNNS